MTIRIVRNIRRVSQVLFFIIFFWLILKTSFEVAFGGAANDIQLPYPVSIFLQFDPLTSISTVLGSGTPVDGTLSLTMSFKGTPLQPAAASARRGDFEPAS